MARLSPPEIEIAAHDIAGSPAASAAISARILAWVIDLFVVLVLLALVRGVLLRFGVEVPESIASSLIQFFFGFLVVRGLLFGRSGQSPGRMLFRTAVLSVANQRPLLQPSQLGRESLSMITQCVSPLLLVPLFRKDRRSISDLVFGTAVIDLQSQGQIVDRRSFAARAAIGAALVIGVLSASTLALLYSSWPVRNIGRQLMANGFQVEGLTGSLSAGFQFQRISRSDSRGDVELRNGVFRYSGLIDIILHNRVVIQELRVGSASIKVAATTRANRDEAKEDPTPEPSPGDEEVAEPKMKERDDPRGKSGNPLHMIVEVMELNNLSVEHPSRETPVVVDRIFANSLEMKGGYVSVGALGIESPLFNLATRSILADVTKRSLSGQVEGLLKTALDPRLKQPIPIKIDGEVVAGQLSRLEAQALGGKIKLTKSSAEDAWRLSLNDVTPREYWAVGHPANNITGEMAFKSVAEALFSVPFSGRIRLRNSEFNFPVASNSDSPSAEKTAIALGLGGSVPTGLHFRGPVAFEVEVHSGNFLNFVNSSKPTLRLIRRDAPGLGTEDVLAELYFGRRYKDIAVEQQALVDHDLAQYIRREAPAAPPPDPAVRLAQTSPGDTRAANRQPASRADARVRSGTTGRPAGVPTSLPPFRGRRSPSN